MTRSESASAASVAPHQLATSANEGAEIGGKKRILANKEFRQKRRRARQSWRARLLRTAVDRILERRAAREVEDLGLVELAFSNRDRQVKADRAHGRVPNQTRARRDAD